MPGQETLKTMEKVLITQPSIGSLTEAQADLRKIEALEKPEEAQEPEGVNFSALATQTALKKLTEGDPVRQKKQNS